VATRISRRALSDELPSPEEVKRLFGERMSKRLGAWLCRTAEATPALETPGAGAERDRSWPMRFVLGGLTEARVMKNVSNVLQWVQAWELAQRGLPEGVHVQWEPRQWRLLGQQQVPVAVVVRDASSLAAWVGQERRWRQACARRDVFEESFPLLRSLPPWMRYEEVATTWSVDDVRRLMDLLGWFQANPCSRLYLRQLPVPGIDTKWVEPRRGLVRDFVLATRGLTAGGDFYDVCGLRPPPPTLRMRVLCPDLRCMTGGLCDIQAPIDELAQLQLRPKTLLVVENLATGLALPELPGAVVFMKLGHAVSDLARIPWLFADDQGNEGPERVLYWGDLDTHGFVILARARRVFPRLRSVLMDEQTLMSGKEQWVSEESQSKADVLEQLTPQEQLLYKSLQAQDYGTNVRLEQERLHWPRCIKALNDALS